MVILSDENADRKSMGLDDKGVNSVDLKWRERPARLQHRFLVLRKLGQGTYGKVQLALNKETNQEVAIKTIKKARIENDEDMLRIRREIYIMTSIRHAHIIHIYEVFETRQKIVIVMQYACGGELYDYLGCHQKLPEEEARRIFRQIASAIYYCHTNQICHRDLKLENILLDEEGNAQIADFGLSNIFDDRRRMNTFCGSPLYASPEIVKGTPYKGPEVDCWSLGVLLYTLIYGKMPFDGRNFKELVSQISEGRYEKPIDKSDASSLIHRLLTPDISRRATISDVCKDSWVNQGYDASLLQVAEKMASNAGLRKEHFNAAKLCLETNTKNGRGKTVFLKTNAYSGQTKTSPNSSILVKNCENSNSAISEQCPKPSIQEQMTNYDIHFIINKIIAAVETSLKPSRTEEHAENSYPAAKEKTVPSLKQWHRNGENNIIGKVNVIPIFEVTSIVPKATNKPKNGEHHERHSQLSQNKNSLLNEFIETVSESDLAKEIRNIDSIAEKNVTEADLCAETSQRASDSQSKGARTKDICPRIEIAYSGSQQQIDERKTTDECDNRTEGPLLKNIKVPENSLCRVPSVKVKRLHDGILFGQKLLGPFGRPKNHSLSLARILSLNYEILLLNSFRTPERKKKPPGKIVIPATFDPTTLANAVQERQAIIVFPTISVSENKEKIEKKIDKIKKAALNMNLIRRSDSKSRLRIQKYLMSQAKKMQDLVSDEQRNISGSIDKINEQQVYSGDFENYYCKLGKNNINFSLIKQHDEEVGRFSRRLSNSFNDLTLNHCNEQSINKTNTQMLLLKTKGFSKWAECFSEKVTKQGHNPKYFSLTKSNSQVHFPCDYASSFSTCSNNSDFKMTQKCTENTFLNGSNSRKIATNCSTQLLRSASDSLGFNAFKNTFESNRDESYNEAEQPTTFMQESTINNLFLNHIVKLFNKESKAKKSTSHLNSSQPSAKFDGKTDTKPNLKKYVDLHNDANRGKICIPRSTSTNSCTNFIKEDDNKIIKRLSSEPFLGNERYKQENTLDHNFFTNEHKTASSIFRASAEISEIEQMQQKDKRELRRRNTVSCVRAYNNCNRQSYPERLQSNSADMIGCMWDMPKGSEILPAGQNDDSQFLSSPNLYDFSLDRKINRWRNNDSKSVDSLYVGANIPIKEDPYGVYPNYSFATPSESKSTFLEKLMKQNDRVSRTLYEGSSSQTKQSKSFREESLNYSDQSNIFHKLQAERKMSLPVQQNNLIKTPFLSNFLNDLEKREHLSKITDSSLSQRRYTKNNFPLGRRSKSESRSKSFLQLLSLKRIQEAEKELEKTDDNNQIDTEDSSGSLLEALKTHGYKNVISQRFLGAETSTDDPCDVNYPTSPFTSRKTKPENPRFNFMYYDTLSRFSTPTYDPNELDYTTNMLNGSIAKASYEMCQTHKQKTPVYDWLSHLNEECQSPVNSDYDSLPVSEEQNYSNEIGKYQFQWGNERTKSLESEASASASESLDASEEHHDNDTIAGEWCKKRDFSEDYSSLLNQTQNGRKYSLFTSTNSDDEREESVQDRIWRKSFYSRFNNSALSRKEKPSYFEPEFLSESRAGFSNNFYSTLKSKNSERNEYLNWDEASKTLPLKRVYSNKKYGSVLDKTMPRNRVKTKPSKPLIEGYANDKKDTVDSVDIISNNTTVDEDIESEPEH